MPSFIKREKEKEKQLTTKNQLATSMTTAWTINVNQTDCSLNVVFCVYWNKQTNHIAMDNTYSCASKHTDAHQHIYRDTTTVEVQQVCVCYTLASAHIYTHTTEHIYNETSTRCHILTHDKCAWAANNTDEEKKCLWISSFVHFVAVS